MSALSLLFILASFLLLALDVVNLSQIVVLVLDLKHDLHAVGLFLIVGINLCIAKLLLFPTGCVSSMQMKCNLEHLKVIQHSFSP